MWVLLGALTALILAYATIATPVAGALYLDDSTIPGKPFTSGGVDELTNAQWNVVQRIYLLAGQRAIFDLSGSPGTDFNLFLYSPHAEDFTAVPVIWSINAGTSTEHIEYDVPASGWYYVRVLRLTPVDGSSLLYGRTEWPTPRGPATPVRLAGDDRYSTAVEIAAANFPGWRNVDHVILASGEDRAAADPLSASGLAWTYGAPIFLVESDSVPREVVAALQQIRVKNGPFYIHIVGGPVSVEPDVLDDIDANVAGVTWDRLTPHANRYELAATIARRMDQERPLDTYMRPWLGSSGALIANGEDPEKFFDALALSPVCVASGWPILLVGEDRVPHETRQALADLPLRVRAIGGGPATVSNDVKAELEAGDPVCARWWGDDRYETAVAIMEEGIGSAPKMLDQSNTGVAARLPDALTGGTFLGLRRGCVLLTQTSSLPSASRRFIEDNTHETGSFWVLGGPVSVEPRTVDAMEGALGH